MATQQGMSGIDLHAMVSELHARLPFWMGKSYQYDNKTFGIRLNGENKEKYNLIIELGRRAHFTEFLPPSPPNPSGYSMFLRKYLSGGRVLDVRQHGLERIIDITVGKSETQYHIIIELFDEGNIILCDREYLIIQPFSRRHFKNREIISGVRYEFPIEEYLRRSPEEVKEILDASDRDLVRTLATGLMLGGRYAEEVCTISGFDKNIDPLKADAETISQTYNEIVAKSESSIKPQISETGCWPFHLSGEKQVQTFETFNEALDAFFPKTKKEIKETKPKLSKEEIIRKRQADAIVGFEAKTEHFEAIIELIYSNYQVIADVIHTLDSASKTHSWQEIEAIVKNSDIPSARLISKIYPAESVVDIKLDKTIKINVHESVEVNINRYYGQVKKFKKKKKGALVAMEKFSRVKSVRKKQFTPLKPKWYHRFRWFYTSDGVLVIGGRDAGSNEDVVKKYMEGGDTFVHADVHGGSTVIVKGETKCWDEVAQFAASYSNAWKAGHFTADVYAADRQQVSKTPESGESIARGSFVIRGERKYFRDVAVGIAIGLQTEPAVAIIGGPVSAIQKRVKHYIVLKPGIFEPNDIAKKVLKALRMKLSEEELKGLRNIINTEKIAAFVPPGGSEVVE